MNSLRWSYIIPLLVALPSVTWSNHEDPAVAKHEAGVEALKNSKFDIAIAQFTGAIKLDPRRVDSYLGRSRAYYAKNEFDKAIADCDQAISIDPQNADGYYYRGRANQFLDVPG